MSKRLTKSQRDEAAKASLRQRVADILSGAAGYEFDNDDEWATAGILSRAIPALKARFDPEDTKQYLWFPSNLSNFHCVASVTDYLFEHGVRG